MSLGPTGLPEGGFSCARITSQAMANINFCAQAISSNAVLLLTLLLISQVLEGVISVSTGDGMSVASG